MTTERLAVELASPTDKVPDWNVFEWRAAMAVSAMHGISALLSDRLRWAGPPIWQAFLAEQAEQGRLREQKVRALLQRLDEAARHAHLPLLAMKGSALLKTSLYAPGHRPMGDVDLLARPSDFDAAHRLVLEAGYAEGATTWKHRDYRPLDATSDRAFGEHIINPIKIELHTAVREQLPVRAVDITAEVFPRTVWPGLNSYPSHAALMRHFLLHAAGNLCYHAIRLIQLHDIATLASHLNESDWDEALASTSDDLPAWWAVPPLVLAQRCFPGPWQGAAMTRARVAAEAACPALLRRSVMHHRLDELSLSGLQTPVLPGLVWSQGLEEKVIYVRRRLHPGREVLSQQHLATSAMKAFAGYAWTDLPRWRKALRFLIGAPPRVTTQYSLQMALAYEPAHTSSA